ncbi:MAG: GNAT family N-acetyltransferase [Candidatus Nanopelagicales bacterium]|jgi:RimJ/RimL family protein N-acetyltransferase
MALDVIRTDRLRLRAWTADDAEVFQQIYALEEVYRWLGNPPKPCPDVETARERIARWETVAPAPYGLWAVETPGIDEVAPQPCGTVLLVPLLRSGGGPTDAVEVGWHLHPAAWGRGIAAEGARALIDRARESGLQQLHAVVYDGNARSMAVCDRLGMTRLGPTTEWYDVELVDHVLTL